MKMNLFDHPKDLSTGRNSEADMSDESKLRKWAAEAAEKSGAIFLDLNTFAADRFDALGQSHATNYFVDSQHTSKAGARLNAEAVVDGLKRIDKPPLRDALLPQSR